MGKTSLLRRLFLIAALAIMTIVVHANPVDIATAREVGAKFLSASTSVKLANSDALRLAATYYTPQNVPAFYVFNTENGFVMVSADDCATPILGYSNESNFTGDDFPVQFEEYFQHFVEQIHYGIEHRLVADEAIARQWELVRSTGRVTDQKSTTVVTPLLTDTWNQNCYYNNCCPADVNGPCGHVYAGCAATSFSQILHYWGYPSQGTGSHSYTPEGYDPQTVNFGATTYQWSDMPDALTSSSSAAQINAVATLMWHCGVAIEMNYGPNGSGANPYNVYLAFMNYFNYSDDLTPVSKDYYTNDQWLNLMKSSLDAHRPIHYSGWDSEGNGGHGFVCDGYDANNLLHFNWGWSGNYNNYYALDALTPDDYDFSYSNYAIINIHPNSSSYQVTISSNPSNGGSVSFANKDDRETTTYDFEDSSMMGWTTIDADGDGQSWDLSSIVMGTGYAHNASIDMVLSKSYDNTIGALEPDNFLVSPAKAEYSSISFYACAQDNEWAAEHFGVAISTTNNTSASAFTTVQEWTMTAKGNGVPAPGRGGDKGQGNWYQYSVDLSAYADQAIWVAIRHFNCSDYFYLDVDDISLTTGGGGGGGNSTSAFFGQGQSCTVTATPNSDYYFANWTENGNVVSNSSTYSFYVNGNRNLVANFTTEPLPPQYTVTISPDPDEGGTVMFGSKDDKGGQWYAYAECDQPATSIGAGDYFSVAIMFPAGSFIGNQLTKVSLFDYDEWGGSLEIYTGGVTAPGTLVGSLSLAMEGEYEYVEKVFPAPVPVDPFQNVWVVVNYTSGSVTYPIPACTDESNDPNGRWVGLNGSWMDLVEAGLSGYNWMIKAYIEQSSTLSASFTEGSSCTVMATPNSGYTFAGWKENGTTVSTNTSYSFTVNDDCTLVASFTALPQQYTVAVSANPTNGGTVSGGGTFTQGQSCTVNATPGSGYNFSSWKENGTVVSTNASYTFVVNGNRTLVAQFTEIPPEEFSISVSASPAEGGTVSGGGTYTQGQTCTVDANANTGYDFVGWTENDVVVSTSASYNFVVNGNRTLVANFTLQTFTVTATVDLAEGGTAVVTGDNFYGSIVTVSVNLNEEYSFLNWTENGEFVSEDQTYEFVLTSDRNLVAHLLSTVGLNEREDFVKLYPNPVREQLTVESDRTFNGVEIYNLMGVMVYSQKECSDKVEIPTGQLPTGIYFIRLTGDNSTVTKRFVKD